MVRRHELTDEEWALLAPLLPPRETRNTYHRDHRTTLDGTLDWLHTGVPWRGRPSGACPSATARGRRGLHGPRALPPLDPGGAVGPDPCGARAGPRRRGADRLGALACSPWLHRRLARPGAQARRGRGGKTGRRASRPTTPWGAAAAGSGPRATSSLAGAGGRSPSPSARRRRTSRSTSYVAPFPARCGPTRQRGPCADHLWSGA